MMRERAGIDIDGVIYEWEEQARALIRDYWGVDLPESTEYFSIRNGLITALGDADGARADNWLFETAHRYGLWDYGKEVPGAIRGLWRLSVTHDIVVITKRPRVALRYTWSWLTSRWIYPNEFVLIPPGSGREKSGIACDWYVDDSPAILEELAGAGKRTYIFDRAWNQECSAGERVRGWAELLERVVKA